MADRNIGSLFYKITGDTSPLEKSLNKSDKDVKGLGKSLTSVGSILKGAAFAGAVAFAAKKVGEFALSTINAASDAEETANKFGVVFRDISGAAEESARVLDEQFGLSRQAAQDLLAGTGDLLTGFGFTQESALDLSTQVNQLAVDLASFTNFQGGATGASEALTKALLGERESVKALGISILEEDVKAQVALNTKRGLVFETERQAKAQATLDLALAQSGNAIGDYARSQNSFANQSREARAAVDDLRASIGERLLPVATESVSIFAGLTQRLSDFIAERNRLREAEDAENKTVEQRIILAQKELEQAEIFLRAKENEARALIDYSKSRAEQERELNAILETFAADERKRVEEAVNNLRVLQFERQSGIAQRKNETEVRVAAAAAEEEAETGLTQTLIEQNNARIASFTELFNLYNEQQQAVVDRVVERVSLEILTQEALDDLAEREKTRLIEQAAFERETLLLRQQQYANLFGALSQLFSVFGDESRGAAIAQKAFASAEAAINSYLAFTQVLADPSFIGRPLTRTIAAGAVLAAGLAQQTKILSTEIPQFANGGIVAGSSFTGDNVPARVNSGEMILNREQQAQLFALANGAGGDGNLQVIVNLNDKPILDAVTRGSRNGRVIIDSRSVK